MYCLGWLFKLEVQNMDELKALKDEKAYERYLKDCVHQLFIAGYQSQSSMFCILTLYILHAFALCLYRMITNLWMYCSGWLFKLEVKNMDELKELMDEKAYEKFLEEHNEDEYQPIQMQ